MAIPDQFIPLRKLAPNVTPRTESVVMKALELSVPNRWQTAFEMEEALKGSGDLSTTSAIPSPFTEDSGYNTPVPTQRVETVIQPATSSSPVITPSASSIAPPPQAKRRKWPIALGVVGALLCVSAICVGGIVGLPILEEMLATTSPPPTTPIVQQPTKTNTPVVDIVSEDFGITIDNQSPYDVCYVFISPVDDDSWGSDWLDSEQMISPGSSLTLNVPAGEYDLLAESCDEVTLQTGWNLNSDVTFTIGGADKVPLWIFNDLDEEVCYLYISPVTSDEWGQDWLGEIESLPSGGVRMLFAKPDVYDFSALNCDEEEIAYQYNVTVDGETEWIIE
jgi:hypothetical protein